MIASLVSKLGPSKVELAEDVAQDAILKALSVWPYKGIPDNPRAWLRRVAGNAAIDRIRRSARELGVDDDWDFVTTDDDVVTPSLSDPELDLMVLCCDPKLTPQDQLFLALKTVCGFTAADTAGLFFISEDALSQRLSRAKRQLKSQPSSIARFPTRFALAERMPQMMKIIYLMFAQGYLPRRGDALIGDDVCREALRLSEGLIAATHVNAVGLHALHALLLFQSSRHVARTNAAGELITLDKQDRAAWDRNAIANALKHLETARADKEVTRYHLEAGIASLHAQSVTWEATDWASISRLYGLLSQQAPSLAVFVNWAVSLMMLGDENGARDALATAGSLNNAQSFPGYHLARAQLAQHSGDSELQKRALNAARDCQTSTAVDDHIDQELSLIE
ncbi:MAG: sigma-70 family RNA polymerase sigma factor [Pseudomonadota bacterium]